jgi:hypothetical protein
MAIGITGQETCILRTDEKYDSTWHHWAGRGSKETCIPSFHVCITGVSKYIGMQ